MKDYLVVIFLLTSISVASFLKVKLVFEYKRDFLYLAQIQKRIDSLNNENTKLKLELTLAKSSYLIQESNEADMKGVEID